MIWDVKKIKVLIADDVPTNIDVLRRILEGEGYNIYAAPNGRVLMDLALRARPDLILLDIMMPEIDGFEACRVLKSQTGTSDIPIIFISAKSGGDEIEKSFAAGAADFIHKPFKQSEVLARVKNQIQIRKLTFQNHKLIQELDHLAPKPSQNELSNSKFLHEFIRWEAFRYQRHQVPFSVIMAGVDQVDELRNKMDKDEWQRLAVEIGAFLKRHSRKLDCTGLWEGQDRFLILLPGTELKGALILARKFATQMKDNPLVFNDSPREISMSFGVSEFRPVEKEIDSSILHMIHQADMCLGRARKKRSERIAAPLDLT